MKILNSIKEKVFGKTAPEPEKPKTMAEMAANKGGQPTMASMAAAANKGGQPTMASMAAAANKGGQPTMASMAAAGKGGPQPQPTQQVKAEPVDIPAFLEASAKAKGIKLDWKNSIVDLMKALDLDSGVATRKDLAAELNYSGSAADGSAEKNMWLHKELMKFLTDNGGKI
ncbi:MAG: DUF3597 domain-containing protein [Treponema sp.]|nr:DUF3597 domain-containing protein [Treponema sp.]